MACWVGVITQRLSDMKASVPSSFCGASLHNTFTSHGPDAETFARASTAELRPQKIDGTLAFMFESRWMMIPTQQAMRSGHRQQDYDAVWGNLTRSFRT